MSIIYYKNSGQLEPAKLTDSERQTYELLSYGETLTASNYFTSSIEIKYISASSDRTDINGIKSILNTYGLYSENYKYSNFESADVKVIKIPSVFYGSKIEKGTVKLDYYVSGSLVGTLQDIGERGELRITYPTTSSIEGVVLYNHGVILITGSTNFGSYSSYFEGLASGSKQYKWKYFGDTNDNTSEIVFDMNFKGTTYTPNITMYTYANKGELNHSNNTTAQKTTSVTTSSNSYIEDSYIEYNNVRKSPFTGDEAEFKKEVYISSVNVYDKNRNLIAIGKLANPVRKPEDRDLIFKLKIDL
jgi:hypothetical protein